MKKVMRKTFAGIVLMAMAACSTERVVDNTVDTSLFATRTVVKTTVGAGKLAVKGTRGAYRLATGSE